MKVVFISNYYNHHQSPFSEEMYRLCNGEYTFIATKPMSDIRREMGWEEIEAPFVVHYDDNPKRYQSLIDNADVVIYGAAPERLVRSRIRKGMLTFKYSERPYKSPAHPIKLFLRKIQNHFRWDRYRNIYLLCASAYCAQDYALTNNFLGKAYRWGYFPKRNEYDIHNLIEKKNKKETLNVLFAGRFLDWKHPDATIRVAKKLRDEGYQFQLNLIGCGEMEDVLRQQIDDDKLHACVHLLGTKSPDEVREYMEQADIFLFTSDRGEGWGAVLNEAMNSGCAVIANREIGSVPYLIEHLQNGVIYENEEQLFDFTKQLVEDQALREALGKRAYETIAKLWNAETAARRVYEAIPSFLEGKPIDRYENGPLAKEKY